VEVVRNLRSDLIIAVGGGSAIDAAKAIRLFHESPQLTLAELTLPFLDARKRVSQYPEIAHSLRLVAVPTTSGTGSEVSPAAVLTASGRKLTLVDYSLVPDMAVVDPRLTLTMPPALTADTGVDALTHALEAGVSIFASPSTDAFCMQALHLILDSLPRACADGSDLVARTAMSNAATLAGLAFSNAFVGVCHSLAHAVGARFGIAHGRANGIFLPHVLRYTPRSRASSCRRPATRPTWRPRSTPSRRRGSAAPRCTSWPRGSSPRWPTPAAPVSASPI